MPRCGTPSAARWETIEKEKLPVSILALDVDSDDAVASTVAIARSKAGFIDAVVNNAGIERVGSIEELPLNVPPALRS
jgi:NAD(P)-dependent dehydrogenase (short-subunit alcohol dehydrogenase family)